MTDARSTVERAQLLTQSGDPASARALLEAHLGGDPSAAAVLLELARVLLIQGDHRGAERAATAALPDHEQDPWARAALARIIGTDPARAEVALLWAEQAARSLPQEGGVQEVLGARLAAVGRLTESAAAFERAVELAPSDPLLRADVHARAAAALSADLMSDQHAPATQYHLDMALSLDPSNVLAGQVQDVHHRMNAADAQTPAERRAAILEAGFRQLDGTKRETGLTIGSREPRPTATPQGPATITPLSQLAVRTVLSRMLTLQLLASLVIAAITVVQISSGAHAAAIGMAGVAAALAALIAVAAGLPILRRGTRAIRALSGPSGWIAALAPVGAIILNVVTLSLNLQAGSAAQWLGAPVLSCLLFGVALATLTGGTRALMLTMQATRTR